MLQTMRKLALEHLFSELATSDDADNLFNWFLDTRKNNPEKIFTYFVETGDKVEKVYVIKADNDDSEKAILATSEISNARRLPFIKPTGSQSPAVGPVIKRSYVNKKTGPSPKIIKTTLEDFKKISKQADDIGDYFKKVCSILSRKKLEVLLTGREVQVSDKSSLLEEVVKVIEETKTVFVTVEIEGGLWPGDCQEYIEYLTGILAKTKYATGSNPPKSGETCCLCGRDNQVVYPNAVKGAGLNIGNLDREGAFSGIKQGNAWKGYSLCCDCADLLFAYKFHFAEDYFASVAGEKALIIPELALDYKKKELHRRVKRYVSKAKEGKNIEVAEGYLMHCLAEESSVFSISILWGEFKQSIEDISGMVSDILPSRLRKMSEINIEIQENAESSPFFPNNYPLKFDIGMGFLGHFFKRPGGAAVKSLNKSKRLMNLKRALADNLYHGCKIDETRFWEETMVTANCYFLDALKNGEWGLLNECDVKKSKKPYLTMAGWVRNLAMLLKYLHLSGVYIPNVYYMEGSALETEVDFLKPYISPDSGVNTPAKGFAFLLGVMLGRVMRIQGGKGISVASNSLVWLRRLKLDGKNLPELYTKVTNKLMVYNSFGDDKLRKVSEELSRLGTILGSDIDLGQTETVYFLLLGISLSTTIIKKEETGSNE